MKPKSRFSWRTKLLLLLDFAIIPAAAVAGFAFQIFEETVSRSHLDPLEGLARAKTEAIDQFTDTRRKDVERMAGLLSGKLDALQKAETAAVFARTRADTACAAAPARGCREDPRAEHAG